MQVTALELALIDRIVHDLYQPTNGAEPESFDDLSDIWADCLLESKADGGVMASLCKKGLAHHSGYVAGEINGKRRNEATVRLTRAGWDVYKAGTPAAACPRCGGWTASGGMSQHASATEPVEGRTGCTCKK